MFIGPPAQMWRRAPSLGSTSSGSSSLLSTHKSYKSPCVGDQDRDLGSEPASDSSVSSRSLLSRHLFATSNRVIALELERTVAALQEQLQGAQAFSDDRLDNLEVQWQAIDQELLFQRGRVESEAASQAARIARLEDRVTEIQTLLVARLESQAIAIARLSRRLQELEMQQAS